MNSFRVFRFVCLTVILILAVLPATAQQQKAHKVLLIGIDGVRPDILAKAKTPNIDRLIAGGAFSDKAQTRMPTVSGPGWSNMLTGVWPEKHRVMGNEFTGNGYAVYPDFLTRLERIDPKKFSTFAVTDWPPLGSGDAHGPVVSDLVDVKMLFNADGIGYEVADERSTAAAERYLTTEDVDAAFVYLGDPDEVAHATNTLSPEYQASIERADAQVGRLLKAVENRPTYAQEDWLILVATDHGRRDDGGHGQPSVEEKTIFVIAYGPSVQKGSFSRVPDIVDVGVTALTHLGVTIDPEWHLDGKPIGLRMAK